MKNSATDRATSDRTATRVSRRSAGTPAFRRISLLLLASTLVLGAGPVHAAPARKVAPEEPVKFAILADPHLYNTKLGVEGTAFDTYLATDPKLLHLSEAILVAALDDIIASKVRFLIICGDLTKDGEILNHVLMTQHLQKVRKAGIDVYVVPGNHDINNADAVEFLGATTKAVPSASPEVFRALYQQYGYGQAIARAPDSLSYLAEPAPGLWLLALDSVKWDESEVAGEPVVSGRITTETMAWALAKIAEGKTLGKQLIAFMHHGVNPHFLAQPVLFGDYLVDQWWAVGPQLAGAGLKVVFTGHYHSQDISAWTLSPNPNPPPPLVPVPVPTTLFDIQTASLASYPCAYRMAELAANGTLSVTSRHVTSIAADLGGVAFPAYAQNFSASLLVYQVIAQLAYLGYPASGASDPFVQLVVTSLMANYAGDEGPMPAAVIDLLNPDHPLHQFGLLLATLWMDPPLPSGDGSITLSIAN